MLILESSVKIDSLTVIANYKPFKVFFRCRIIKAKQIIIYFLLFNILFYEILFQECTVDPLNCDDQVSTVFNYRRNNQGNF